MAVSIALLLIVSGMLFRLLRRQHQTQGKNTEPALEVLELYQDNAAVSTVQMHRPPPTMPPAVTPTTYLNQDRHRFTKQGLRPVNHRIEESVSIFHSVKRLFKIPDARSFHYSRPRTPSLGHLLHRRLALSDAHRSRLHAAKTLRSTPKILWIRIEAMAYYVMGRRCTIQSELV